eukprot:scaffold234668_cov49-Prasinocladus_malaysianus.AAC.3
MDSYTSENSIASTLSSRSMIGSRRTVPCLAYLDYARLVMEHVEAGSYACRNAILTSHWAQNRSRLANWSRIGAAMKESATSETLIEFCILVLQQREPFDYVCPRLVKVNFHCGQMLNYSKPLLTVEEQAHCDQLTQVA